jgi:putative hydrolase of the HAD superfamily
MYNKPINENHISLDFWGTLVFSNIKFRNERAKFLSATLNKEEDQVNNAFKQIGVNYNLLQEKGLIYITPFDLFCDVLDNLNVKSNSIQTISLYNTVLEIFITNTPIINTKLKTMIDNSLNSGKTISILSNTAFIPGSVINKFLDENFGVKYFSFKIFSDEVKIAKPNLEIFKLTFDEINLIYKHRISKNKIIHIGDNYKNDVMGAKNFGFNSRLI